MDESMGENISEGFMQLVRTHGDKVLLHTQVCVEWKRVHPDCKGCESSLGCAKAVSMLGVSLTPMIYQPKDYQDFEHMNQSIQDKLDKILSAKTVEEVHLVRW